MAMTAERWAALTEAEREERRTLVRTWRAENPERVRAHAATPAARLAERRRRLKRYGITVEQYDEILAEQGGVCAICGDPPGSRSLAVDHDHRTGIIRGLLCVRCNQGLGCYIDDPDRLIAAAAYLIQIEERP